MQPQPSVVSRPRVLSAPPAYDFTNTYMLSWYQTADVEQVLRPDRRIFWNRSVFNPLWLWKHRDEFDVYHVQWRTHLVRVPFIVSSALLCRRMGKRVLWTAHEPLPHHGDFRLRAWFNGFFLTRLAHLVIAHNEFTAAEIGRLFLSRRKVEIIEHPDYRIHPVPQAQAKKAIKESQFTFLTFGFFKWYKGLDLLTTNFDPKVLDAVLYILGHFSGPVGERDKVTIGCNGVIFRSNRLTDQELDLYISAADVIVIPYRICYTSGTVHRSLQMGKPLVVSKAVGRTLEAGDRIVIYEDESRMHEALVKARQMDTTPLPAKRDLNFEHAEYQARVRAFYREGWVSA